MTTPTKPKSRKGFASMTPEERARIASMGGKAAHAAGRAHRFNSQEAVEAGRKGGAAISKNREHMARIGAKGGSNGHRQRKASKDTP